MSAGHIALQAWYKHLFEENDKFQESVKTTVDSEKLSVDHELVGSVVCEGYGDPRKWFLGQIVGWKESGNAAEGNVFTIIYQDLDTCSITESAARKLSGLPAAARAPANPAARARTTRSSVNVSPPPKPSKRVWTDSEEDSDTE